MSRSLVYDTSMDEIHSFESFFGRIFNENNDIKIPFVNLGISDHPVNPSNELKYIDKSYLVFKDVASISENYDVSAVEDTSFVTYYFGGLDMEGIHREFQVKCKNAYLELTNDYRLSSTMWQPSRMNTKDLNDFFNILPGQID